MTLTCAFRYGREDLDVLGLTFRKDLFVANIQAFPPLSEEKKSLTRLQERLIKKLGEHAYPFTFEVLTLLIIHPYVGSSIRHLIFTCFYLSKLSLSRSRKQNMSHGTCWKCPRSILTSTDFKSKTKSVKGFLMNLWLSNSFRGRRANNISNNLSSRWGFYRCV